MKELRTGGPEGNFYFQLSEEVSVAPLEQVLKSGHFFEACLNGTVLKDSATCSVTAGTFPGMKQNPVFIKRTKNKSFRFTLRYLLRRARAFRAAEAGEKLRKNGIATPKVFLAGECRSGLILRSGFLVTEFYENAGMLSSVLQKMPEKGEEFLRKTAELAARLHQCGVYHGDFKLQNVFLAGNTLGVWDLDGARIFEGKVPACLRCRDLARLTASCAAEIHLPEPDLPEFLRLAAAAYGNFTADDLTGPVHKFLHHRRRP